MVRDVFFSFPKEIPVYCVQQAIPKNSKKKKKKRQLSTQFSEIRLNISILVQFDPMSWDLDLLECLKQQARFVIGRTPSPRLAPDVEAPHFAASRCTKTAGLNTMRKVFDQSSQASKWGKTVA